MLGWRLGEKMVQMGAGRKKEKVAIAFSRASLRVAVLIDRAQPQVAVGQKRGSGGSLAKKWFVWDWVAKLVGWQLSLVENDPGWQLGTARRGKQTRRLFIKRYYQIRPKNAPVKTSPIRLKIRNLNALSSRCWEVRHYA